MGQEEERGKEMKVISFNPPCPKCKSYMFMVRFADGIYLRKCTNCGFRKPEKRWTKAAIRIYFERLMFWKSSKGRKVIQAK